MHSRHLLTEPFHRLAAAQAAVVTREQALSFGVTRHVLERLLRAGAWVPLARGIYLTVPVTPEWIAYVWAGVLIGGDGARVGGLAAAYLHGLQPSPPPTSLILVPASRTVRVAGPWSFQREKAGARTSRSVGSPPRLTAEATVIDLCDAATPTETVQYLTAAVQKRISSPERLVRELDSRAREGNRRLIRDVLGDVAEGAESPLELAYLRDAERAHSLPRGRRQVRRLGLRYVGDVGYDDYRVLVELDGRDGHSGTARFRDMRRDNTHASLQWLTLRYGWFDVVDRPCHVAWQVAGALVQRGWSGLPKRCRRCVRLPEADLLAVA